MHFRDLSGVDGLALPDGSHLDERDAPAFTATLLDAIDDLGVLPASTGGTKDEPPREAGPSR